MLPRWWLKFATELLLFQIFMSSYISVSCFLDYNSAALPPPWVTYYDDCTSLACPVPHLSLRLLQIHRRARQRAAQDRMRKVCLRCTGVVISTLLNFILNNIFHIKFYLHLITVSIKLKQMPNLAKFQESFRKVWNTAWPSSRSEFMKYGTQRWPSSRSELFMKYGTSAGTVPRPNW